MNVLSGVKPRALRNLLPGSDSLAYFFRRLGIAILLFWPAGLYADYTKHPKVADFTQKMVKEHGFSEQEISEWLKAAEKKQTILDAISRPAEKTLKWFEYRKIFLGETRINQGVEFWRENEATLVRAREAFGVPEEVVVAIIGVETRYGRHKGKFRVIDALSTLGFDYPPRARFFRSELEQFLLLAREQKQDPLNLVGSYAGAMGYGQFIPSSYRAYAVDFDQDDIVDIWQNKVDAIGSVANYFKVHGWQDRLPVMVPAQLKRAKYDESVLNTGKKPSLTLQEARAKGFALAKKEATTADLRVMPLRYFNENGEEFWFGYNNFYVITRYNRSRLYARAVWELSREIKRAYALEVAAKE